MRVTYTVEIDDAIRREINRHYGKPGLASRAEVQDWYRSYGRSLDDDLSWSSDSVNQETARAGFTSES